MLQQQSIELGAIHMICVVLLDAGLFSLFEANMRPFWMRVHFTKPFPIVIVDRSVIRRCPRCTKLVWEALALHDGKEVELTKYACRRRHQRFANMRPREELAFEYDAFDPGLCQIRGH